MTEGKVRADAQDAVVDGVYHFLDMGGQKYGECTLAVFGNTRILIDGGHVKDFDGQTGTRSIPRQLAEVLEEQGPHEITLLIVTHCHDDHVGCLLDLVEQDIIRPKWALVTHPKLGFGRTDSDSIDAADLENDPRHRLAALLREEDASDLSDADLREFIDAVVSVETRYKKILAALRNQGTTVIPYRGQALPQQLKAALANTGFKLLGPTEEQLVFCAEQIRSTNEDAMAAVDRLLAADSTLDDVGLYRAVTQETPQDAFNARGNGMNCQSITIAVGKPGARALLAGDMQFAEPGVHGADAEVRKLRQRVVAEGPYRLFKTTHHTSHNGQDDGFLDDIGSPTLLVHSGGRNDATHPNPDVLRTLKLRGGIKFARTDRNGLITVSPHLSDDDAMEKSKGRFNDFTANDRDSEALEQVSESREAPRVALHRNGSQPQVIIVNLGDGPVDLSVAGVEIVSRPRGGSSNGGPPATQPRPLREPPERRDPAAVDFTPRLGAGRPLPRLLFVTDPAALARNIGSSEAGTALAAVRAANQPICEVDSQGGDAVAKVRGVLRSSRDLAGVVLLGGYDVVPSTRVDVLDGRLRRTLGSSVAADIDEFIVWSDEPYGDLDGDRIGELPVSRIPDGRNARLFLRALSADGAAPSGRFGVRNVARPFADEVWGRIAGGQELQVSEKFLADDVTSADTAPPLHYFMLHGKDSDARTFWGELESGEGYTTAFHVDKVPKVFKGIVFTGCCWGALTVSNRANEEGVPLAPRVPERSIALLYLMAGANAFVGCTGSHYSGPDLTPEENYAIELHTAFWRELMREGKSAASALFGARRAYGQSIAERTAGQDPADVARRLKNRAQFTCLGLGW